MAVAGLLAGQVPVPALAQTPAPETPPADVPATADSGLPALGEPAPAPDRFSFTPGLVLLPADYTTFSQDADSKAQVGNQRDQFEPRSIRLMGRGHFQLFRTWNYVLSYEYKGFTNEPGDDDWSAADIKLSTKLGPRLGTLSFGKLKETYVYEMVGDAANLPHSERLLNPFFVSRNIGATLSNNWAGQQGTWSVGVFNDWFVKGQSFSESGTDVSGRFTYLPVWRDEGTSFVHLGASFRYYGADNDLLRYRGTPASNVADYYVDTGQIPGDHAWQAGLEALLNKGGWSLLFDYAAARLSTDDGSDPLLQGYYLTGSWVITGETRTYDRGVGYARRVMPQRRGGAWELIARYGRVDLDDGSVAGGTMDAWSVGLNWWATRRFKASVAYGDVVLDRFGTEGSTRTVLSRVQWIY